MVMDQYAARLCKQLKTAIKTLSRARIKNNVDQINQTIERYSDNFPGIIQQDYISSKEQARRWAAAEYQTNSFPLDKNAYKTLKGDIVRSKAELWIADYLFTHEFYYRYEPKLSLKGGECYYPDFALMNPKNADVVYIEYFGMMDDEHYRNRTFEKINKYAENGYCLGHNLLAFFESTNIPFNPTTISKTLDNIFLK